MSISDWVAKLNLQARGRENCLHATGSELLRLGNGWYFVHASVYVAKQKKSKWLAVIAKADAPVGVLLGGVGDDANAA